jgi:hypothetical protein
LLQDHLQSGGDELDVHVPPMQYKRLGQTLNQAPQFSGSFKASTQEEVPG